MTDVAERAGVSRALVSIVFRDLPGASPATRDRVRRAAEEIGYRPDQRARLLSQRQTRLLGVTFGVGHEFHSDLISHLYDAGAAEGYALVLSGVTQHRTEAEAIHELQALRCDALILLGPTMQARDLDAIGRQTPTVTLARAVSAQVGVVRTDDVAGAGIATRHLIGLGHTGSSTSTGAGHRGRPSGVAAITGPCARQGSATWPAWCREVSPRKVVGTPRGRSWNSTLEIDRRPRSSSTTSAQPATSTRCVAPESTCRWTTPSSDSTTAAWPGRCGPSSPP